MTTEPDSHRLPPMPDRRRARRRPFLDAVPDYILVILGVGGLSLSGWSLGTLLHNNAHAPWPVAVFGVAVFDLLALLATLLVYQRRTDPWSAVGARTVMMLAMTASAIVNGAHGYSLGGWTTAAVLAAAPLAFEVGFELRHRTLTALVWALFRREAMWRLRYDAWTRIALRVPAHRPDPDVDPDPGSGRPADVPDGIRTAIRPAADAPELPPGSGSGRIQGIRAQVEALYDDGVTDPARIADRLPDADPETIRRYVRTVRKTRMAGSA